ncbi:MAG: DUF3854 domain-containing protein [Chloroflexota bacterium]|nr:DUF3854 domain-containing protein [Chloroflexota bacterium]
MATLSAKHRHMLEVESGIAPEVIAARGYYTEMSPAALAALGFAPYQCRPGMVIPQWTTAGVQVGHVLRPDNPRHDPKNGRAIKYETPEGSRPRLDVPPSVAGVLRDPTIPIDFTEGSKKADAAVSLGRFCISLNGVYGFLTGKLVIPDFDDIALAGRRCRIIYDSDVCRKPSVRDALDRLAALLERRGAIVDVVYLPEGADGAKVGLDDFKVADGTSEELDALARPWQPNALPFVPDPDDPTEVIARLQRERDDAKRAISTLIQVGLNPHLKAAEKVAYFATFGLVQQKRDRGDVEPDGTVHLSAAEIADDWRPDPEKGEHVEPFNKDGSRPRMARDKVRPLLKEAVDRGLLPASPRPSVRRRADGSTFKDTGWAIAPPTEASALLAPAAGWCPEEIKPRKPRRLPCPHCNEVHAIVRKDYCQGCGSLRNEAIIEPPAENETTRESESSTHLRKIIGQGDMPVVNASPPAPPRSLVRQTFGGATPAVPQEPAHLSYLFEPPAPPDRYTDLAHGRRAP